jgi:aspartate aminotransferase-like enzyme
MEKCGVDALISAPQKGWTGPSCAGLVMLSERGADVARASRGSSFVCDLRKWLELMDSYEAGASPHAARRAARQAPPPAAFHQPSSNHIRDHQHDDACMCWT